MQPRTFKKNVPNARIDALERKSVLLRLTERLVEYFKGEFFSTQEQFDEWHKEICARFVHEFNNKVMRPSGYKDIEHGKAQKIVNIAFKYLYLFCDIVPGNPGHFTFCHFAIDNYTLKWYNGLPGYPKCSARNWSDMTYDEYIKIQEKIREYITKNIPDKTPFEAEFEIWSDLYYGK